MKNRFRILSIDGGGVRGMIPAMIVAELEKRIRIRTGKADCYISDCFDLIAGTSAGGILACFYLYRHNGNRFDASKAVDLYEKHGKTIFQKRLFRNIIRFFDALYPDKGIDRVLHETFGDAKLSDAPCNSAVMAYHITDRKAVIFTADSARKDKGRDYLLRDIARATSAAPTYFRVAQATSMDNVSSYLIDGGIYANDPTICALVEARKTKFRDHDAFPGIKDMYVLSLGTGNTSKPYRYESAKYWGVINWAIPVIDMLQSSSAEVVSYQTKSLFEAENRPDQYIRIVPELYSVTHKMDDASAPNIANLKKAGAQCITTHSYLLDKIVNDLTQLSSI
jgi:patatin-like phospholipase/acyl hydrolase